MTVMDDLVVSRTRPGQFDLDFSAVLNALPGAILVVDPCDRVLYANHSAENLFQTSASQLVERGLAYFLPADSTVMHLLRQVRSGGYSLSEYGVNLETPRFSVPSVTLQLSPVPDSPGATQGSVVLSINQLSIAHKIDQQLTHRNAARSVTGMTAILAHEVKNPLAGIRGAAQLLEQGADAADRELTRLICDEADRICALVDRMEIFSDQRPTERGPVNIHSVLEHVRKIAQNSFGRHVRFSENYDPSLPPVYGIRDQLIQVFLNLVKNAVDAAPPDSAEIVVSTAYRHGIRLALHGGARRVDLPLVVSVQDNGSGVPEDLRDHLFDPFVTTKADGHGLGLALVAKFVGDHGGVIEFESEPRRTVFRVMLPVSQGAEAE
jgi:two-component system nitrogen regulation sensor histidine kinase GlnL